MKSQLGLAISLAVAISCAPAQSAPDRSSMVQAESDYVAARQAEANGQLEGARTAYWDAVGYVLQASSDNTFRRNAKIGGEPIGNVARRAIALQKQLLDKETTSPSGRISVPTLTNELQRMYKTMQVLEPDNPTWLYLDAVMIVNTNNYVKASAILRRCINCSSGSPQLRNKATTLLAHIKPAYTQQRAWLDADWEEARKRRVEYMKRPIKFEPMQRSGVDQDSPNWSDSSSSSSSVPSWEAQAQNAERNGDYAAADRFRSGSSSMSDGQKYWGN